MVRGRCILKRNPLLKKNSQLQYQTCQRWLQNIINSITLLGDYTVENQEIKNAIIRSQHCQRNWDLSKQIPEEDLDVIITSVTECPSKQNIGFYKVIAITDRDVIEKIHLQTNGFTTGPTSSVTNSQVLANLLLVFVDPDDEPEKNMYGKMFVQSKDYAEERGETSALERDKITAIGIAAGYSNVVASMLGYQTGCCACYNSNGVKEILGIDNEVHLLMGIGYKDETRNRREHHYEDFVFPAKKKQKIKVDFI